MQEFKLVMEKASSELEEILVPEGTTFEEIAKSYQEDYKDLIVLACVDGKVDRTLGIYTRLMGGYIVSKTEEAQRYGVNERTIQRDIDDIRNFLETEVENSGIINSIIYVKKILYINLIQRYEKDK